MSFVLFLAEESEFSFLGSKACRQGGGMEFEPISKSRRELHDAF